MKSRIEAPAAAFRLKPEATHLGWVWLPGRASPTRDGWLPALAGRSIALAIAALSLIGAAGCRQDMHNQPKYRGLRGTAFFTDGGSARPLVEGTVARGTLQDDAVFFTGKAGTATVKELPFPVDDAVLNRGQERFNIYCTPCHDATGSGKGMVVQRGFKAPPSFHDERLRNADRAVLSSGSH